LRAGARRCRSCPAQPAPSHLGLAGNVACNNAPIFFAIFTFLNRIASRAPDFFKIPRDAIIEVGFRVEI
jgi:hypothetical protein